MTRPHHAYATSTSPRTRLAPLAELVHLSALGGLGAFLLVGLLACGPEANGPRARVGVGGGDSARVSNNGSDAREADYPSVVRVEADGLLCTGSLVDREGRVLTAGHCVMDEAMTKVVPASNITVKVNGVTLRATSVAVHEGFSLLKDTHHDLAVITVPLASLGATPAPAPLAIAGKSPGRGTAVTMIGYGVPTMEDDVDRDGVRNDLDHCPATPSFLVGSVEKSGGRAGCETTETSRPLPGAGAPRSPDSAGVLRKGTNVISGLDLAGGLLVKGPFTTIAKDGEVTPSFGDSGGPLLDPAGRIVGTVQGGSPVATASGEMTHEAFFVDVNLDKNRAFLNAQGITWKAE